MESNDINGEIIFSKSRYNYNADVMDKKDYGKD